MKFEIDGCKSNGDGIFTFLNIDLIILKKCMKDQDCFCIANFLIIKHLEHCYFSNVIQYSLVIGFSEIIDIIPCIEIKSFSYKLKKLRKIGFLDFKKISGSNRWLISLK